MSVLMRRMLTVVPVCCAIVGGMFATPAGASGSEQVVFSVSAAQGGGIGFWIWCQASSPSPTHLYAGICNGSMYFYEVGGAEHVAGQISETDEGLYSISVQNTTGSYWIECTLNNPGTAKSGPTNDVVLNCPAPDGVPADLTEHGVVVRVTG